MYVCDSWPASSESCRKDVVVEAQELVVDATMEGFASVEAFAEEYLDLQDVPFKLRMPISVSVEEMFVNIVHYAYPDGPGKASARFEILDNPRRIKITFKDRGIPYDPLAKEDPDITASANDRLIGGLGIFMTKKFMDEVSYAYEDGQNVFSMTKYL